MKKLISKSHKKLTGYMFIAISTLISCKKLTDIPPNPPNSVTRAEQFADSASTLSAVTALYSYTYSNGFPYSDAGLTTTTALSAHEVSLISSYSDEPEFYSYTVTPLNSSVTSLWSAPFQALYQVNDVLSGITNNAHLSPSFVKQITGEMEVNRALYYFNLVNLFGDVPLVTTTNYKENAVLPRAPASTVYSQILIDLQDAVKKLPANYPSAGRARPNLYTAQTLLAKVHLYQGKWQAAYNEADSVIRSGVYNLPSDLNQVFLDGSKEAIWQLPMVSTNQGTSEASNFLPYTTGVTPSFLVTDSLLNQFETGDQRFANWLGTSVINGNTLYFPFKYKDELPTSPATDFMIFRLAEVYLIRAEAAAELNNLSAALADVNVIRARAGLAGSSANAASQSAILAAVMKERRTELFTEWGNRWFDLIRTGKASAFLPGFHSFNALYPIPQAQIQLNNKLIQNPGYQ